MTVYDRPELSCDHVDVWLGNTLACSVTFTDQHASNHDGLRALARQHGWACGIGQDDQIDLCPRHAR